MGRLGQNGSQLFTFGNIGRGFGMLPGALASLGGGGNCLISKGLVFGLDRLLNGR